MTTLEQQEAAHNVVETVTELQTLLAPHRQPIVDGLLKRPDDRRPGPPRVSHNEAVAMETVIVMAREIAGGRR